MLVRGDDSYLLVMASKKKLKQFFMNTEKTTKGQMR